MNTNDLYWRAKVAAWLHDPAEKMFVLRSPGGHEGGTVRRLCERLFSSESLPNELNTAVRRADRWASAADRPDRPRGKPDGSRFWDKIDFPKNPELIHPLSGQHYRLQSLQDLDPQQLSQVATGHLLNIVEDHREGGKVDWKRLLMAFWRLASEVPEKIADDPSGITRGLGELWRLLPADSRVPDHTIWDHLRLTSSFAGFFACDQNPALLLVSLGPVQRFIAQARSTSDLWAGSHLLSFMTWKAIEIVAEKYGPDVVLFPNLHAVPIVDVWLEKNQMVRWPEKLKQRLLWRRRRSDANPLFSASLPNRFLALVPEEDAEEVAHQITGQLRRWVLEEARGAWGRVLDAVELENDGDVASQQIQQQLAGFPEIHWAAVPWSLVEEDDGRLKTDRLQKALAAFFPGGDSQAPGFLGGEAWKLLGQEQEVDGAVFFSPNPGFLYPALYELVERTAAAAKQTRPFEQTEQEGYRCSLCGEREWLTPNRGWLNERGRKEDSENPWYRLQKRSHSWGRKGECLCALCTLKRVWPALFSKRMTKAGALDEESEKGFRRYVVSIYTMSLAPTLKRLSEESSEHTIELETAVGEARKLLGGAARQRRVALPRKLVSPGDGSPRKSLVQDLPSIIDALNDLPEDRPEVEEALKRINSAMGDRREQYYALLLMDGDRMGAWLSSDEPTGRQGRPRYEALWHTDTACKVKEDFKNTAILDYLSSQAPPSPAYHASLSRSLNDFSLSLVPELVEVVFMGKVLYAGGDDLMAMCSVEDLLPLMLALRCAYSGIEPKEDKLSARLLGSGFVIDNDHVKYKGRLYRTLGRRATASIGAVVAHHKTPLGAVLRDLRAAERRAKEAGRNAFSITLAKRAGGTTSFTAPWGFGDHGQDAGAVNASSTPAGVLFELRECLSQDLSRRAAYNVCRWLPDLPAGPGAGSEQEWAAYRQMLEENIAWQFEQQAVSKNRTQNLRSLAKRIVDVAVRIAMSDSSTGCDVPGWLDGLFGHAEFLARRERSGRFCE